MYSEGSSRNPPTQHRKPQWLWLFALILVPVISFLVLPLKRPRGVAAQSSASAEPRAIGCLGRIEPADGVIHVSAPYFAGGPAIISELNVKQGDWVKDRQVLAVLASRRQLESAEKQAQSGLAVARRHLDQVKQGAKPGDIAALQSQILQFEAVVKTARAEYQRYQQLHQTRDVSASELDQKQLAVESAENNLDAARHRLDSLSEIRKVDVAAVEAEVSQALADVQQASVQLETSVVRAPRAGRILKTYVKAGEAVGQDGLLELADTSRMVVMAEVYETDISRIRLGQHAAISSNLVAKNLEGVVTEIGSQIVKNAVLPSDPVAFADSRIVKVRIEIPDGKPLSGLIYGKVNVVIQP